MAVTPDGAEPVEHSGGQTQREKFLRHTLTTRECLSAGTVRDSKEYPKAQDCSLPNRRESTEKSRVGIRDRRSRGDDCATSRQFSRWNEEQGPHPETSVSDRGLGTGGLVHARKGCFHYGNCLDSQCSIKMFFEGCFRKLKFQK